MKIPAESKLSQWSFPESNDGKNSRTDAQLIKSILQGKKNDFEILLNRYRNYIWAISSRLLPLEVVPDITQEIFVEAYRHLDGYDQRKPLKNWLAGIALHRCRDHWRREYRRKEIPVSGLSQEHQKWVERVCATDGQTNFGSLVQQREAQEILEIGLAQLSEKNRLLLILIYFEGFSVKEVAQMLNWSQINVKVRAYRARKQMRTLIQEFLDQENRQ
ncbi:RNA polymerase sigma factor [Desulfobulbus rhabdoformis]|uniref:RNA polymerase sigma factor n=1 Tax=Desulfobulbus rhabdoformis TaxID=34032 RepID=UPI001962F0B7|nr:RNA polymerase sigma factor [Desulfobulbus rhabdoformis]MBM9615184.1 RNA polymerase sigma factor [Desulfobulbus rhabdoformis]